MTTILISLVWFFLNHTAEPQPAEKSKSCISQSQKSNDSNTEKIRIWTGPWDNAMAVPSKSEFQIGQIVNEVLEDKTGGIWIATGDQGLCLITGNNYQYFTTANGLPDNEVLALHLDKSGRLWAGTASGLAKYEKGAFKILPIHQEPRQAKDSAVKPRINRIYEDKNGNLWIGTEGSGLFKYDGTNLINVIRGGC